MCLIPREGHFLITVCNKLFLIASDRIWDKKMTFGCCMSALPLHILYTFIDMLDSCLLTFMQLISFNITFKNGSNAWCISTFSSTSLKSDKCFRMKVFFHRCDHKYYWYYGCKLLVYLNEDINCCICNSMFRNNKYIYWSKRKKTPKHSSFISSQICMHLNTLKVLLYFSLFLFVSKHSSSTDMQTFSAQIQSLNGILQNRCVCADKDSFLLRTAMSCAMPRCQAIIRAWQNLLQVRSI